MTMTNERMRAALREIESRAAAALHDQPNNTDECERHLNKALAGIELKAHVARWGADTGRRIGSGGRGGVPKPRNGEAEAVANAVGGESVAQAGTCSNTG